MHHKPPLLPPAIGLLVMLAIFAMHFIEPILVLFPYPWNFLGLVPVSLGAVLNIAADRELQRAGTPATPFERSRVLVERGVYRLSRNPMYLGFLLIAAGLAIWVGSLSPWLVLPFFAWALLHFFIRREERQLVQEQGQAYLDYCQRVNRWWGAK